MTEKNYKDSLNLPQTAFPMKAGLPQREPAWLEAWEKEGLYQQIREHCRGREKFILSDGPPYANGDIHIGHAVNKVLKDIIIKFKTLDGFDAPYVPGWDCHGLPVELKVEKKVGKPGQKLSEKEFFQACRKYAQSQVDLQRKAFIRLGILGDWFVPYQTMDPTFEANIIRSLRKIIANDHLERGFKPVHWCTACGSALAEAEVEYPDKNSISLYVAFSVADQSDFLGRFAGEVITNKKLSIPIWTTTPWTLPANEAVALHGEITYVLVNYAEQSIVVAESLCETVMQQLEVSDYSIVAKCEGQALSGLMLQHPFLEKQVPVLIGDHVTVDAGTGAVHTAPAHGLDDYQLALAHDLPVESPVDDRGCYISTAAVFPGEHVFKANDKVVALLEEKGKLLQAATIKHSYPHCWRHKTPLIFRATPQWFISMDKNGLREKALEAIRFAEWMPSWGSARIADMVSKRPDWCISRQRLWDVPMALFIHRETQELHPHTLDLMEKVADIVEVEGIEAWRALDPKDLLGDDAKDYIKINDTLDVWFDSGVVHTCVVGMHPDLQLPADLVLEGSDQHRGWFQSSLLTSVAMHEVAPYKAALTHGFTVDAKGRKMSKSIGNVIAPEKVVNSLGADVLRLWVASTDYSGEMTVSDEILKRTSDTYRRLRNTARFLLANLHDFDPEQHMVAYDDLLPLDKFIISHAHALQEVVTQAFDDYQFHVVCHKVHHFCSVVLGGFYLDVIKDRQYTMQANSVARRSAQTAMQHVLEALVRWLAPITSFTAEEIWQHMPGKRSGSVMFATWYEHLTPLDDSDTMNSAFWEQVMQVRDQVNRELESARQNNLVRSGLQADVTLYCDDDLSTLLTTFELELHFLFITSNATVRPLSEANDAVDTEMPGLKVSVMSSPHKKCIRCWHHQADIGHYPAHPALCGRCVMNVTGKGEQRRYA